MDFNGLLMCILCIASSAAALRCYQCTSDQSGGGACIDSPDTDNIQVINDCKGACYVTYSQTKSGSVTSRGCYSRKSFCTETCLGIFADINNCQHCCDCDECNDVTASSLSSYDSDYDCSATTTQPPTTRKAVRQTPEEPSTTQATTAPKPQADAFSGTVARTINLSFQILLLFAFVVTAVL